MSEEKKIIRINTLQEYMEFIEDYGGIFGYKFIIPKELKDNPIITFVSKMSEVKGGTFFEKQDQTYTHLSELYNYAVESKDLGACYISGKYYNATFLTDFRERARELLTFSAKQGHLFSILYLTRIESRDEHYWLDICMDKFIPIIEEGKDKRMLRKLVPLLIQRGKEEKYVQVMEKLCDLGCQDSIHELSDFYLTNGRNPKKGIEIYKKIFDENKIEQMFNQSVKCRNDENDINDDLSLLCSLMILKEKYDLLKKENDELKEIVEYIPDNSGYLKAKGHFEEIVQNSL